MAVAVASGADTPAFVAASAAVAASVSASAAVHKLVKMGSNRNLSYL